MRFGNEATVKTCNMIQYGIFNGIDLTVLTNATHIEGAINIYLKRILLEDGYKKDSEGKILTKENLQDSYNDWADTMIENMENDGYEAGTYIINMEDMIDNWSNRAWVVTRPNSRSNWEGINNTEQYKLIKAVFERKGIEEKEYIIKERV